MRRPGKIGVLMGGVSREREISLESGRSVLRALREAGYLAEEVLVDDRRLSSMNGCRFDVAFIALHGAFGEDGGAQAILEARQIPYTGSGVEASRRAMDKTISKKIFQSAGIPTPVYEVLNGVPGQDLASAARRLGYPIVVKPAAEGSSIGVSIATGPRALERGLREAHQLGDTTIMEQFIEGRELTVGILGEQPLPIIEIKPARRFFDYQAKYIDDNTVSVANPEMPDAVAGLVKKTGLRAFQALGCSHFGRVDMILSRDNVPYVLEVNTIPGFTSHSLLPKAAAAAGMSFPDLCSRIIEMALD